ncbi:cytochrome c biogenesis protein CcsA [Flavobacterium sp. DG1-102-2]|uniref:cytochrome c biogenesis protein CcsA n=1 Tax=Flavobacterium sp. DG1-102-2 TaxID=3081663 RepID=UPI002948FE74|nr:cytochrome c biogenesis protein CcsA [Flavobacterium sp. DG1-102-2]MDV6167092.1 cytochrome c biogenesis protein CcsA [Flavobacterium sp. DG1-102-2]
MDKIISFFSSTRLMAVLFLVFALAMGIGTFIEDAYNTDTARIFIYNAKWFEAIMLLFVINFFGNIKRYQLHKKEKWATLLLHLSFIFIIIGAFVTRYISYEGMMPIREGAAESRFYSDKTYLTVFVDGEYEGEMRRRTFEEHLLLSPVANNNFSISEKFADIPFDVEYKDFKLGAKETVAEDPKGIYYLKLVEAGDGGRHEHYLKEGEVQNIHNLLFALNIPTEGAINITIKDGKYTIKTPFEGDYMRMADKATGDVVKDADQPLMFRSLYNVANARFVFPDAPIKGKVDYIASKDFKTKEESALTVVVKSEGEEKEVTLLGGKAKMGVPQSFKLGKLEYTLMYGSRTYTLPFAIKLNDFIANKYPGTESSYESFESKVTVEDKEQNTTFDARIYMNHVLDYNGYRFFQSGFDPDEKGTNLSVSHDFYGTWISYIGYFLLYIGLMAILFDKNTRFGDLKHKLDKVKAKKAALSAIAFFLFVFTGYSQNHMHDQPTEAQMDSIILKYKVSEEHAAKFGRMIIQDAGGRMKPINTFSSELLRKVSKSDTYKGLNSDQVFLSMAMMDQMWFSVPIIQLKRGNDSLRIVAGLEKEAKFAALSDFFDAQGNYKLTKILEKAYRVKEANEFEKDYMDIDKRINLLYSALTGQILKVYPVPNDKGNKWVSYLEIPQVKNPELDKIKNVLPFYIQALAEASQNNDYKLANSLLEGLTKYQHKYGASIMPSDDKVNTEILYNKYDIFKKLYSYYALAGILMFLFAIIKIFNSRKWVSVTVQIFNIIVGLLFLLHTAGLIARWYISGHAPWSNAYESVIYVAWATTFFGLAFGFGFKQISFTSGIRSVFRFSSENRSELTVASTAFVAAMVLWVAHQSWTDPEIGNLVPVLNSYWLMIHVAVIVGCYGPFTLGMILGLVSLILMIFTNDKNKVKMELNIKELTYINEMTLTVGLVMLSIGNFLGGQWANESWGRYWGWDPKETWALVSIMVYAFVIHMRFVPALRGSWIFNFFSVLAFASILMTYFGVNFYLTGLHSYASGEVRTPVYFLYMAIGVFIIGTLAYVQYRKYFKK